MLIRNVVSGLLIGGTFTVISLAGFRKRERFAGGHGGALRRDGIGLRCRSGRAARIYPAASPPRRRV
jgi:hypothetical protein